MLSSSFLFLPGSYLYWHYGSSLRRYWELARDWLWFAAYFFSLAPLAKTFFQPWRRLGETYSSGAGLHPAAFLETVLVNGLMRLVGILFRSAALALGLAAWILVLVTLLALFFVWLVLPVLTALVFIFGLTLLIRP